MTVELTSSPALPLTTRRTVQRALSLLEKHLREPGALFTSTAAARDWLRLKMTGLEREVFMVLYLDNQHRLLECETLFSGTINSTEVHPREVVKSALRHNAAAVLLAEAKQRWSGNLQAAPRLEIAQALIDAKAEGRDGK